MLQKIGIAGCIPVKQDSPFNITTIPKLVTYPLKQITTSNWTTWSVPYVPCQTSIYTYIYIYTIYVSKKIQKLLNHEFSSVKIAPPLPPSWGRSKSISGPRPRPKSASAAWTRGKPLDRHREFWFPIGVYRITSLSNWRSIIEQDKIRIVKIYGDYFKGSSALLKGFLNMLAIVVTLQAASPRVHIYICIRKYIYIYIHIGH